MPHERLDLDTIEESMLVEEFEDVLLSGGNCGECHLGWLLVGGCEAFSLKRLRLYYSCQPHH